MSIELPQNVGPYRVEELLSRGGMGEVYRAYDQRLDRWVAIKHLRPELADAPRTRARIRREARALARLSHPAIVPVFDLVENSEGDWIVMELVEGVSLAQLLRRGALPFGLTLRLAQQLAAGLAEAHGKGILHRDLKAENVMISRDGQARIVDFGLAKTLWQGDAPLSLAGTVLGTCHSMSPEQARGFEVDHRSDLFSLGALLYEMLAGHSPFKGPTQADTLARVLSHQPPLLTALDQTLPPALAELVDRLLEKAPELRPQRAQEVEAVLASLITQPETSEMASRLTPENPAITPPAPGDLTPTTTSAEYAVSRAAKRWLERWRVQPRAQQFWTALLLLLGAAILAVSFRDLRPLTWSPPESAPPPSAAMPADGGTAEARTAEARTVGTPTAEPRTEASGLHRQGMALLQRFDQPGQLDTAIATFRRAVELDPEFAPAYAGLARAYWLQFWSSGQDRQWLDLALPAAERGVALDEHLVLAGVSLALVRTALGRYPEAAAELTRVRKLDPSSPDVHRALGLLHLAQQQFPEAETAYRTALTGEPNNAFNHDLAGELYYRTQRFAAAEAAFRKSLELRPDSALAHRNLGGLYKVQGRLSEAAAELQRALEIQPKSTVYANLGAVLFAQGLYVEAARAFERALAMGTMSHDCQAWANLGDALRWSPGRAEEARAAFARAIHLVRRDLAAQPDDLTRRTRLVLYLAKLDQREEALTEALETEKKAAGDAAALYRLAVAFEILGQRDHALATLIAALDAGFPSAEIERDPELLRLRTAPAYLRRVAGLPREQ